MYNSSNALYHNFNLKPCFCYNTEKKISRIDYSNWTSYNNNLVVSSLLLKPISFIWILITLFIYSKTSVWPYVKGQQQVQHRLTWVMGNT